MPFLILGSVSSVEGVVGDPNVQGDELNALPGQRECHVNVGEDPIVALQEICGGNGVVAHHFAEGTAPVWVEGDYPALVEMIAGRYGIPVGRPSGWADESHAAVVEDQIPDAAPAAAKRRKR